MHRFARRVVLSALLLAAAASTAAAAGLPFQRASCSAVSGRNYAGGCPQMEGRTVTIDAPEANFPDSSFACMAARNLATQQLTEQLRIADRARGRNYNFCSGMTIRCVPTCGQVQK
ncbi:MAG TPA: hypothetical protein VK558_07025 [Patescibacteria group bacterium]|nr:hypothetical protein [Patescibacteria group bacterium]